TSSGGRLFIVEPWRRLEAQMAAPEGDGARRDNDDRRAGFAQRNNVVGQTREPGVPCPAIVINQQRRADFNDQSSGIVDTHYRPSPIVAHAPVGRSTTPGAREPLGPMA